MNAPNQVVAKWNRTVRTRSLAVSVATTILDAGLFALATFVLAGGTALLTARWLCGALGAACNFLCNRRWVFRTGAGSFWAESGRYAITAAAAVSLATIVWWAVQSWTGWDARLVHLLSLTVVWLLFTFPLLRGWVFRPSPAIAEVGRKVH